MRVITTPEISSTARLAAAVIALFAWVGLVVQLQASTGLQGSVASAVWVMLRFFTVLANLFLAIMFTGLALGKTRFATPSLVGCVTLAILLVGIIYAILLRGLLELSGGAKLADLLLHTVTPLLVPLYWLIFAPKGGLRRSDPSLWMIVPLAYFAYALVRASFEGVYPYPFMDVAKIGWMQTGINAAVIAFGFVFAGYGLLWLDGLLVGKGKSA